MAQINMNIRIDSDVKQEAEQLFNSLGLNMASAFSIFVRQSLRVGGIPFKIFTDEKRFYNEYNQIKLNAAVKRMKKKE